MRRNIREDVSKHIEASNSIHISHVPTMFSHIDSDTYKTIKYKDASINYHHRKKVHN